MANYRTKMDDAMPEIKIDQLYIYPVKSLAGIEVSAMEFDQFGPVGDRRWMIIDDAGKALTQRELPQLALLKPQLSTDSLILQYGQQQFQLPVAADKLPINAQVWQYQDTMLDCGNPVAEFLSDLLQTNCRLVTLNEHHHRVSGGDLPQPISLVDSRQLLVTSVESLTWLNLKLAEYAAPPIQMDRFRPNIMVSGGAGIFYENNWQLITSQENKLIRQKACGRCKMITIDQQFGKFENSLPLRILAQFNRDDNGKAAAFGTYFNVLNNAGKLQKNSRLEIQER